MASGALQALRAPTAWLNAHPRRLPSRRLPILLGWAAATVTTLLLFAAGAPVLWRDLRTPCSGDGCPWYQVDAATAESLRAVGLSLDQFAVVVLVVDAVPLFACVLLSTLLARQWRRDRMALAAAFMLVTFGGTVFQSSITALGREDAWYWPVAAIQFVGSAALLWFFAIFPDGRFVPRWTRWLALAWTIWAALGYFSPRSWPINQDNNSPVFPTSVVPFFVATVAAQVYRYRLVSDDAQRHQSKWVLIGFSAGIAGILLNILVVPHLTPPAPDPGAAVALIGGGLLFDACLLLIPAAIAASVLRYRLFDVDVLLDRALVYGGMSACVIGLYVGIVGYLGALLRTGSSNVAVSLVATGVVALAFQPLRERLQRAVNRLVYGERVAPYAVLSQFGRRLGEALAPDAVLPAVVEIVAEALKLPYVAISLPREGGLTPAAGRGEPVGRLERFPLTHQNEVVGELIVAPRGGSVELSAADCRLLADLARQAGAAVHAVRLSADLLRSRERLVAAREEERRRIRRDLHDGLGPVLAAQALRAGSARALYGRDPAAADALLAQLEGGLQDALDDIRRLVYDLRPPALDQLGLAGALRDLVARHRQAIPVSFRCPDELPPLPAGVEVATYRIADEALTNAIRHGEASRCDVSVRLDGALRVEVADDGGGLPAEPRLGVGLTSMRERAEELGGSCRIEPNAPRGTRVIVDLPVPAAEP